MIGHLGYRGHKHGEVFEATLDPGAEHRALARRNIRVIDKSKPTLQPGSYKLPPGWADSKEEVQDDE